MVAPDYGITPNPEKSVNDPRATAVPQTKITTQDSSSVTLSMEVRPDLTCLQGHFADHPIVPGIALLDWAVQLADQAFRCGRAVAATRNLKFKKIVEPNTRLELRLEHLPEQGRVKFSFASAHGDHASGIFELVRA